MDNDTVEECKANFFDDGGPNNSYTNNVNNGYTTDTFVIETADTICLTFTSFDIEVFDTLMISATCNGVFTKYTGNTLPPQTISNCGFITIVFKYDNSGVKPGWAACWTTKLKDLEPPDIDANPVPSCNDNSIIFDLTSNVPCDSIYGTDWVIRDYLNQIVPVTNAVPFPSCNNDSTDQIQVFLGGNGIEENCDYTVEWELRLTDRCDSTWIFEVLDTFYVTDCPFPVDLVADTFLCPSACTDIEAIVPGCLTYLYAWSPNIGTGPGPYNVCPTVTTTYTVTVTDSTGNAPATVASITIEIVDPEITEPDTVFLCQTDPPYTLTTLNPGGWWQGPGSVDSSSLNGTFDPSKDSISAGCHTVRYHFSPTCYDEITVCVDSVDAGFDEAACPDSSFWVGGNWGPSSAQWSGPFISPGGFFSTPTATGVYTVTLTSQSGCTDTKDIYVDPIVVQTEPDTICQSDIAYHVPFLQSGGILTGTGVIDSVLHIFNAQIAGPGTHTLTFALHGCSTPWIIEVLPVNAGPNQTVCPGFNDTLTGTPLNGTWSYSFANGGNTVNASTGEVIIHPNSNNDNIRVVYHAPNGCSDTLWIYVRATKIGPDTLHFCEGDPQLLLNYTTVQRTPGGGIWTGPGTVNGNDDYFVPTIAGVGQHMIYYSTNGCTDSCLMIVYPNDLPLQDTLTCSAQTSFLLDSTLPATGIWSGSGIVDIYTGEFDPGVALIDTFYVYWTSPAGCTDSILIKNYQYFDASINGMDSVYCFVDSNYAINYVPSNDTVFVDGVPSTTFNPAVVDTGWHILTLDFGPSDICYNADTVYIYVMPPISTTLTLDDDTICKGDGTIITVSANGGDSSATYYSYAWSNNPNNTSNSNNVGPDTTTTYYVTTSDGCSDPIIDTVTVNVAPPIEVEMLTSEKLCYGDTGFAFANVTVPNDYSITWNTNPVQNGDSIISTAGEFINFEITDNGFGCKFDSTVKIPSWLPVSAVFLVNPNEECIAYEFKDDLNIIDLSNNAITGTWEFSNGNTEPYVLGVNPDVPFDKAGQYSIILRVENEGGCPDSMEINVCIDDKASYFIPDAFSPNDDGLNDILYLRAKNVDKVKFVIYGRWGEKIFETEDLEQGWDGTFRGKPMNSGIFVYYADIIFVDGRREVLKGDVSLVR